MNGSPDDPGFRIEAFDRQRHDRSAFSSGVLQVDNYLRLTAGKLAKADNLRLFVLVEASGTVRGFYGLTAHAIEYTQLPTRFARTRPNHGSIPAAFIAMIGVDRAQQGKGWGGVLLVDALQRVAKASRSLGIAVVLLDILDCGDPILVARRRRLYESYGFQGLPSHERRMFLPAATIVRAEVEDWKR